MKINCLNSTMRSQGLTLKILLNLSYAMFKQREAISDFRVVCDETNNTAAVIDNNEFIADIFIKPARSINFIGLTFVATRTGISFEEVIGTV